MDRTRIHYLSRVYQHGEATPAEREEFLHWYRTSSFADGEYPDAEEVVEARILARLLDSMDHMDGLEKPEAGAEGVTEIPTIGRSHAKDRRIFRVGKVAAAVLLIGALAVGYYALLQDRGDTWIGSDDRMEDVLPGGNRAQLILSDGRVIDLSPEQSGIVVGEAIVYADGEEVLEEGWLHDRELGEEHAPPQLVLTTPNGGQYQVTLPDGTTAWLNAGSTLRYPAHFATHERIVELEGEAFFEVEQQMAEPNAQPGAAGAYRPFLVKTDEQTIEVLGTDFNVSAYADEPTVKTTLIEGRVKLHAASTGQTIPLLPGEQGILSEGRLSKTDVEVSNFVAWKEGRFSFEEKSFEEVMRELGRWYDLDIVYEGPIPDKSYYGGAYRSSQLSIVMRLLRSADVDYRKEGRKLIIRNNQ